VANAKVEAKAAAEQARLEQTYSLTLCNKANVHINAAISAKDSPDAEFMRLRAWYRIAPGACREMVTGQFGDTDTQEVQYHARNVAEDLYWGGANGVHPPELICMSSDAVNHVMRYPSRCRRPKRESEFKRYFLTRDRPELTVDLDY
jgi:hypothetical protein